MLITKEIGSKFYFRYKLNFELFKIQTIFADFEIKSDIIRYKY
jgi:hypothetical protein